MVRWGRSVAVVHERVREVVYGPGTMEWSTDWVGLTVFGLPVALHYFYKWVSAHLIRKAHKGFFFVIVFLRHLASLN